jgi:hypothetical protein
MVYLCFLIPICNIILLAVFYKKFVIWWELIVPIVISVIFILIAKAICISSLTDDVEWLGGYVTEVRYYEDWNERVSCRHPIYCISCSGSGKNRSCHNYVCGHHHPYDVDYHPEYWTAETTLGSYSITKDKYNKLVNQFRVTPQFVELNRDYHTDDGDMYKGVWQGEDETLEAVTKSESYENRPKAAVNVYHFEPVDTFDINQYKLLKYTEIYNQWYQDLILGYSDLKAEKKLQILNARLGRNKQIRVFFCIFKNQPREAGQLQEQYWEGSNKNEFIVCIGIDDLNNIQWAYDFSWSEKEDMKVDIRTYIESQDKLNLSDIVDHTYNEIQTKWVRKDFKDFDYLTIEPTLKQVIWILILTLVINVGIAFWVVLNEID